MFRAKDTFWAPGNRRIVKGDLIAAHDPVLQGRESLFEAVVIPQAIGPDGNPATPDVQPVPGGQAAAEHEAARSGATPTGDGDTTQAPAEPAPVGGDSPQTPAEPASGDTISGADAAATPAAPAPAAKPAAKSGARRPAPSAAATKDGGQA